MKFYGLQIVAALLWFAAEVHAQQDTSRIHILARAQKDAILLRIAPGSPALWELSNKFGYTVERFTVTRGNEYLADKERKLLTPEPLKPWPVERWEKLAYENDYAAIAAEAIYGETFELSANFEQDVMQVYNKAKELESRYSFALFSADVSVEVARASGLYIRDDDVRAGERYLYRVYSMVPQNTVASDTGYVYISLEDSAPLPGIRDVNVKFGDKQALISWSVRHLQSYYTAYWIERSENGTDFKRITKQPYTNLYAESREPELAHKIDSLGENGKTYYYRITGISPFGELGQPSGIVSGEGVVSLNASPAIRKTSALNQQCIIEWEFPKESEYTIKGFEVQRSHSSETGFKSLTEVLPPSTRTFVDNDPEATNYYRVSALGKSGERAFSFPSLFQLVDSIPPNAPVGLSGSIDTTGMVTLHWQGNAEKDLMGYRVFRSNFRSAEFSQVTRETTSDTIFNEKISIGNLSRAIYYKVQAIDNRFNPSSFSEVFKLTKPDMVPPTAPVIKSWRTHADSLFVVWIPSSSRDVSHYFLKTRQTESDEWMSHEFTRGDEMQMAIGGLKSGRYEVMVVAQDSSMNTTQSKKLVADINGKPRKGIEDIQAAANRDSSSITLKWNYAENHVRKILIYRAEGEGKLELYKSIDSTSTQFVDDHIEHGETYVYCLKVIFNNGGESMFGKRVEVKF